ncbi:MAG: polyphosphate polymerase domain-containing protein [Actinobacteria bacterium]|nr:polyphosphate polymerase domain-containing protein [Actinomycetota bacterium]
MSRRAGTSFADVTPASSANLACLKPVCLDDLNDAAALQTRRDRKYLIPETELSWLVDRLSCDAVALEISGRRSFQYESVYFDTPSLQSYLAAARGRPHRIKVRTRTYMDSGRCALEVKQRDGRGRTVKHRTDYPSERRRELDERGQSFVDSIVGPGRVSSDLRPVLTTRYSRSTLLLLRSNSRVTIDTNLRWSSADGAVIRLTKVVLLETKSEGRPSIADRLLWSRQHRPITISKYATGMAAFDPALPANKWNRVLREHFGWAPSRIA